MPLEELPHHLGSVHFLSRPCVSQTVDADHANLATVAATVVAHRGQRPGRILQNHFRITAVVTGPARERVRNTLQPLVTTAFRLSVVRVLRVGQSVECQDRYGPPRTRSGPAQSG